jgi:hypothetical protein
MRLEAFDTMKETPYSVKGNFAEWRRSKEKYE